MDQLNQVAVYKKANVYFDGKVTSRTVMLPDGSKATLGIMLPGTYTFSTDQKERMDIQAGELEYRLENGDWIKIEGEGSFDIAAHSSFEVKVVSVVDYYCTYG
ncbi:pyrimidine/purine nucleoside phosphorylase [Marinicrinis sediminis]|uniref:Pyrimidine/purine nucleoside phosphorylase n=1 Tax=Marinicrinis sediminis TaxID=1652465 RepID=A0ABW5RD79_9BACL